MTISELYLKMLHFPDNEMFDINHLTKVWAYAKTIGESEGLDKKTQFIVEAAAIVHDIACPMIVKKYGHDDGKLQEELGPDLAIDFFRDTDITKEELARICYLIAHHHTPQEIDGIDYQILIEADYLVNADELNYPKENIQNMLDKYYKTKTGIEILKTLYLS